MSLAQRLRVHFSTSTARARRAAQRTRSALWTRGRPALSQASSDSRQKRRHAVHSNGWNQYKPQTTRAGRCMGR